MSNEYTCDDCSETFEKTRTDEEALKELEDNFGVIPKDQRAIVCDDCYNKIMNQIN